MKRFNHTIGFFAAAALAACTGDFESFNTNPDAVQSVDKKTYITTMQMDAVIPCSDVGANEFQRACNLMGDAFGGYLSPIQAFNGGSYTCTYDLDGTDYNNVPFSVAFTNVMPAWLNLKYAYQNGQVTDDVFAVAEVIKVMALQRTTDIYGPIPVSNFGQTENPYESQETVYKNLLTDLNAAIVVLKEYAANAAGRLYEMAQAGQLGQAPHGHAHPFRRTYFCPNLCRGSRQGRGDDRFGRRGVAQEFRFGTGIQSARRGVERL